MANPGRSADNGTGNDTEGSLAATHACLYDARSWFSDSPIDFELACTATSDGTCQVIHHLPVWNEFLYFLHYELRDASGTSGQLSLVDIDYPRLARPREGDFVIWQQVNILLNWLLETHRCIGTLDLKCSFSSRILHPSEKFFCDALRKNQSIKTFKMNFLDDHEHENVCAAIASCANLERLELELSLRPPAGLSSALATLLRTTAALAVLKIPQLHITEQEADSFLAALRENTTLMELSVFESPNTPVSLLDRSEFAQYLKNTATLRSLTVEIGVAIAYGPENRWLWILDGICGNRTIREVSLQNLIVDKESSQIIANIFTQNNTVRSFTMISRSDSVDFRFRSSHNCGGIEALMQNGTLEDVTLSSHIWPLKQWGLFFAALARQQNLRKATVHVPRQDRYLLPQLGSLLQESGAKHKAVLDPGSYFVGNEHDVPDCGAFSRVCAFRSQYTKRELSQVLKQATVQDHVTNLFLHISVTDFDESLASAISEYVRATSTLQNLHLYTSWKSLMDDAPSRSWKLITPSFFENDSIKDLSISATFMDDDDIERLADAVKLSNVIRCAEFKGETPEKCRTFFRRLSANIVKNYNILRVNLFTPTERDSPAFRDWYAVWEVARRNSDLVRRAAAFASGARSDRCCASALERVSRHPALPEEVAQLCSVGVPEAARMIREAFARLQPMDEFMRLCGVIQERVVCYPRGDGCLQLHDLNEYCWAALRRYLTLCDVKECAAASRKTTGSTRSTTATFRAGPLF